MLLFPKCEFSVNGGSSDKCSPQAYCRIWLPNHGQADRPGATRCGAVFGDPTISASLEMTLYRRKMRGTELRMKL